MNILPTKIEPAGEGLAAVIILSKPHITAKNLASVGIADSLFTVNVVRICPIPAMNSVLEFLKG